MGNWIPAQVGGYNIASGDDVVGIQVGRVVAEGDEMPTDPATEADTDAAQYRASSTDIRRGNAQVEVHLS